MSRCPQCGAGLPAHARFCCVCGQPTSHPVAVKITCAEAARLLSKSARTLEGWRRNRRGPPFFKPKTGRLFYLLSDVLEWKSSGRVLTRG